jgi:hypothetical protein
MSALMMHVKGWSQNPDILRSHTARQAAVATRAESAVWSISRVARHALALAIGGIA